MWRPPSLFAQPSKFTSSQLKELEAVDREERDRRDMVVPAWQGWGGAGGWPAASWSAECVWGRLSYARNQPCGFLTTEPGAVPGPSSWPLSPGPAGTKGTALGHTELRDEEDPYGQRIPGATERPCQLLTRTLLLGLGIVKPVPPAQVSNETSSQRKQMENTWLFWASNTSLSPQVVLSDTGESIVFGQFTLALTSWASKLLSHKKG